MLPYRGTEYDAGRARSHKRFAVAGYLKKKFPSDIAREMDHDLECTERYIHQFRQIKFGFERGMTTEEVAFITNSSISLVEECKDMID